MHSSSFNDLIGLKRAWAARPGDGSGTVDCCLLAAEVHKRLGYADYTERFEWVYELYDEQTFPRGLLVRWMLQNGTRLQAATPGAVALLPTAVGSALGTILEDGAMFLAPNNTVVKAPLPSGVGHYFWMHQ
jgi:hypothetical protein